jgi:toxin ParE1/3/4
MRVVWTDEAKGDLTEQIRYIAARDRDAASRQRSRVQQAISSLRQTPRMGRPGTIDGTRELVISGTSYIAVYGIVGEDIEIYHVYHGRQDWQDVAE